MRKPLSRMPLVQAIAWIVGSALMVAIVGHLILQHVVHTKQAILRNSSYHIVRIVQTGPQKEALSTLCLAEVMGLSIDRPIHISRFNIAQAEQQLAACPVIEKVHIALEKPHTVHVDYHTRQPIAWLYDYVNIGIDEKACCFPVSPYFSAKNLPEIYLGLFSSPSSSANLIWNHPLQDERLKLAMTILHLFSRKEYNGLFLLRRIDVASAFAESCGQRQIVLKIEEHGRKLMGGREFLVTLPLYLRLSVKNVSQEVGNYLVLRQKLWDSLDLTHLVGVPSQRNEVVLPARVIDLRIDGLAFMQ